jgi:DNA-binding CsgD family transcriptional regulator
MKMERALELHREAEGFMGRAAKARAQNRPLDAAEFDRHAAAFEAQVFDLLPPDRPKTRGITAVSSVALYRKAGALDEAIRHAQYFLTQEAVADFSQTDLEEMVEEMRAEQFVSMTYSSLTPRQQKVLALRLADVATSDIAAQLRVSPRTVQRTMEGVRRHLQESGSAHQAGSENVARNGLHQKLDALIA